MKISCKQGHILIKVLSGLETKAVLQELILPCLTAQCQPAYSHWFRGEVLKGSSMTLHLIALPQSTKMCGTRTNWF